MADLQRVWLLQTPSPVMDAWRNALRAACDAHGWDFAVHERGHPVPTPAPERSLLVVAWLDQAESLDVTHWAVQLSPPLEAARVLKSQSDMSDHDALYETSLRLATARAVAQRGAQVFWCDEEAIELPGLGRIEGPHPAALATAAEPIGDHPLSMFEKRFSPDRDATIWGMEQFIYPDPRPSDMTDGFLSLVGRRRLLFNGPNIFLPPGRWRFSAQMSIRPPGHTELLVEWGHGYEVSSLTTPIDADGLYELSLEKSWTEVQPADFRISLMIPALEGEFAFHGGRLTRLAS